MRYYEVGTLLCFATLTAYAGSLTASTNVAVADSAMSVASWQQLCDMCRAATQTTATDVTDPRKPCFGATWEYAFLRRCAKVATDILGSLKGVIKDDVWEELNGLGSQLSGDQHQHVGGGYVYMKRNGIDPMYGIVVGR